MIWKTSQAKPAMFSFSTPSVKFLYNKQENVVNTDGKNTARGLLKISVFPIRVYLFSSGLSRFYLLSLAKLTLQGFAGLGKDVCKWINKLIGQMSFRAKSSERGIFRLRKTGRFLGGPRNDMKRHITFLPAYFVNAQQYAPTVAVSALNFQICLN